mgnify:CR=1 FL=1
MSFFSFQHAFHPPCPTDAQRAIKHAPPAHHAHHANHALAVAPQTTTFSFPPSDHASSYRIELAKRIQAFTV